MAGPIPPLVMAVFVLEKLEVKAVMLEMIHGSSSMGQNEGVSEAGAARQRQLRTASRMKIMLPSGCEFRVWCVFDGETCRNVEMECVALLPCISE